MATEGRLKREGFDLVYQSYGSGTPILLLAGGPGLDPAYFEPLAEKLGGNHRALVLHQRGTGRSTMSKIDSSTVSLELLIADIEALREHLAIERLVLLGHSWGGVLAMAYARAHPESVRGLILVGSGGISSGWLRRYIDNVDSRLTADERRDAAFWTEPKRLLADPERAMLEYSKVVAPALVHDREVAHALVELTLEHGAFNVAVNRALLPALGRYDYSESLSKLAAPVLVIQGRQDPVGEPTAHQIANTLPGATLHFIERCGHWPFVEQPEEFDRVVGDFLGSIARGAQGDVRP